MIGQLKKTLKIFGKDTLLCDIDGDGLYSLVSSREWNNPAPKVVENEVSSWFYEWEKPQNPIGKYIPAKCYIRATIQVCDMGICKKQTLPSNYFFIR